MLNPKRYVAVMPYVRLRHENVVVVQSACGYFDSYCKKEDVNDLLNIKFTRAF